MKIKKESAFKGADKFQILLYNAKHSYALETALRGSVELAADLFHKTSAEAKDSRMQAHIEIEAIKILEDTIARLQKVTNMAKKDGNILWRLSR